MTDESDVRHTVSLTVSGLVSHSGHSRMHTCTQVRTSDDDGDDTDDMDDGIDVDEAAAGACETSEVMAPTASSTDSRQGLQTLQASALEEAIPGTIPGKGEGSEATAHHDPDSGKGSASGRGSGSFDGGVVGSASDPSPNPNPDTTIALPVVCPPSPERGSESVDWGSVAKLDVAGVVQEAMHVQEAALKKLQVAHMSAASATRSRRYTSEL